MPTDPVKSFFAIHEVVVLSGFTKHMLDYLAREEIFAPTGGGTGRGSRRRYTYADVVLLRALKSICAGKGKIRHLRASLMRFREEFGSIKPGQTLNKQLFVQGDELCVYTAAEGGRQLRSGQLTFSFVIDLSVVSRDVADCIVMNRGARGFSLTSEVAALAETERQKTWKSVQERRASAA